MYEERLLSCLQEALLPFFPDFKIPEIFMFNLGSRQAHKVTR